MAGRIERYLEDSVILKEGEINNHLFVVNEGAVVLYLNYGTADEYIVGICGKNKVFGEAGMLIGEPSRYTAVAFSDCKVTWLDEKNLVIFFRECPDMAIGIMKKFALANRMYSEGMKRLVAEINEGETTGKTPAQHMERARQLESDIIKRTNRQEENRTRVSNQFLLDNSRF